jgi:uridine kinase
LKPLLVGIAGASCSGKTELARSLYRHFEDQSILFPLDHYYIDRSTVPEAARGAFNFDHPEALDAALLVEQVQALKAGRIIEQPRYSFVTHSRLEDTEPLAPHAIIFVEGLFSLYWPELRDLLDLKIYVETGDEECHRRRLRRDVAERGRSVESIEKQYAETVRPMAMAYVRPTKAYADLVVSGAQPIDESVSVSLNAITALRNL